MQSHVRDGVDLLLQLLLLRTWRIISWCIGLPCIYEKRKRKQKNRAMPKAMSLVGLLYRGQATIMVALCSPLR